MTAAFGSPPRDVKRIGGVPVPLRIVLFLLIPHVWVGLFLISMVVLEPAMALLGRDVTARVVSRELVHSKSTRCRIVYAYDDGSGRRTDSATFREEDFKAYPPGKVLHVRTLRVGPIHRSQLSSEKSGGIWCMLPFALICNGIMFGMFYGMCLSPLADRRLIQLGQPAVGRITGKAERKGKGTTFLVLYVYQPSDGRERIGQMTVSRSQYETAQPEQNVVVFYDPMRSSRSVIYRYCNYAARDRYGYSISQ